MSYHHLTISERIRIEVLSILGYSTRFITKYLERRKNSSCSSKYNDVLSNLISEKLHENWSPEQISNALLNGKL